MPLATLLVDAFLGCGMVRRWRRARAVAVLALAGVAALPVAADTQALVLWIGRYPQPGAWLKGSDADGRLGLLIAQRLGAGGRGQVLPLNDQQLDFDALRRAVRALRSRLQPGDTALIYFSGHGQRMARTVGTGCREGLVAFDGRLYFDSLLRDDLEDIAQVAGQVVVFNDSCHAAGAVSKSLVLRGLLEPSGAGGELPDEEAQLKSFPGVAMAAPQTADDCARPVNVVPKSFRGLPAAGRIAFLAAAREDEAAFSTPQGSLASQGWAACLDDPGADRNHDGHLSANELSACAQRWVQMHYPERMQTLSVPMGGELRLVRVIRP